MLLENVGCESWDGLVVGNVEDCRVYVALGAVLLDELLKIFFSTSTYDDARAGLDQLFNR